jgi:murein DD-endopeptidase MepM/ murein hydrolase activator NlpD
MGSAPVRRDRSRSALIWGTLLSAGGTAALGQEPEGGALGGGGPVEASRDCIPAWERAGAMAQLAAYEREHGPLSQGFGDGPNLYPFYPQACNLYNDVRIINWVDLDPTTALRIYTCGGYTYDGHAGIDSDIRWFAEQSVGVPIFAALDGTVVGRADGNPDMNTAWPCANLPANYVIVDHGGGRQGWYWHMRNGSVVVALGQPVRAGQQLGLTASSGCSSGPHLHFESHQNGAVYEPFAGACRAGTSGWALQPNPPGSPAMTDFGVTSTNLSGQPGYPTRLPTSPQILLSNTLVYVWALVEYLPANSTYQFVFVRPNGTTAFTSAPAGFNNALAYSGSWWWWSWNITDMHSIAGTWRIRVLVNGLQLIDAPVEVVQTVTPGFNRPPQPIGVALDPSSPDPNKALFCRVATSPTLDDLDWDLVRYTYEWRRNGAVVRTLVSAGQADALGAGTLAAGDVVRCTVTPSDGQVSGTPAVVQVTVGSVGCYVNCDASTAAPALNVADFTCFLQKFAALDPYANCDASTTVPALNVADFTCFLQRFATGCP